MRSRCSSLSIAIALCAALVQPGFAGERSAAYEQAFKSGTELFGTGEYTAARAQFELAYAEHPEPLLLLNIGSTYRREGELERAREYYRQFLAEAADDDEYRATAEEQIAVLDAEIAAIAEQKRREAEAQRPPPPKPEPIAVPPPPPPRKDGRALRISGIATAAVGAVLVGVSVQQGLHAGSIDDELANASGPWTPERQARFDEGESAETRAIVFGVTGGIAIAAGATLYLIGLRNGRQAERDRVTIAPYLDSSATGFAITGRF